MLILRALLGPLLMFLTVSAFADEGAPSCLDAKDVAQVQQTYEFHSYTEDKGMTPAAAVDLCNPDQMMNRLVRAVMFLSKTSAPLLGALPNQSPEEPGAFFQKRISKIVLHERLDDQCGLISTMAYVPKTDKHTIHVCPGAARGLPTDLSLASALVHEARHTDGFSHIECQQGIYQHEPFYCDDSYGQQGSYGVQTSFLLGVYKNTDNALLKQEARTQAVMYLTERFNHLPLNMKAGALLQTQQGQLMFYDGKVTTQIYQNSSMSTVTMDWNRPLIFNAEGSVKEYAYSAQLKDAENVMVDRYLDYSPSVRQRIIDVSYGQDFFCFLATTLLYCEHKNAKEGEKPVQIYLTKFQARSFLTTMESAVVDNKAVYIAAEDGYLYLLPQTFQQLKDMRDDGFRQSSKPYNLISLSPWNNDSEIAVNMTGHLLFYNQKSRRWTFAPGFEKTELKRVVAPINWSQQLQDL